MKIFSTRPTILLRLPSPQHHCEITLNYNHNHPLKSAHALSFRDISSATIQELNQYFEAGHSASSAKHAHESLMSEQNEVEQKLSDRALNPNYQDVQRLFYKWKEERYMGQEMDQECLRNYMKKSISTTRVLMGQHTFRH